MSAPAAAAPAAFAAARDREFASLSGIYLNAAGYGPQPNRALVAIRRFERDRAAVQLRPEDFGPILAEARAACARLVGASAAEITLTPNTSAGINIAASMLRRRGRTRPVIVLPDGEFPANVYPWLALQRDGFRVERVPGDEHGCPDEGALLERLQHDDVGALAISSVQFSTGFRADLRALGAVCSERDILFVVDAVQHVGAAPLAMHEARIDVLACGAHKWLCGPFGTGFACVRSELARHHEPDLPGWLAFASSLDFTRLLDYRWDLYDDARRFEVGSLAIQGFVGLTAAAGLLLELGTDRIERHVRALQQPLAAWALESDAAKLLVADEARRAGILSIRLRDAEAVLTRLAAHGITVVEREGAIRFAPHLYNTLDEMEEVAHVLRAVERR